MIKLMRGMCLKALGWEIRGGLWTVVVLYFVDALLLCQGAITVVVAAVMVVLGLIDALRGGAALRRRGVATICSYAVLALAVLGTICANNALARHNATHVIDALERYKADHCGYPQRLEDLVPGYLPSVPLAKFTLAFNSFFYSSRDGKSAHLFYIALPPFGRPTYLLEANRWTYID
ncbi:MAG: hypothetical protein JWN44_5775 [Myxococcales bacterium]|nr:hypothetical protein [Myxococcales bacterium]